MSDKAGETQLMFGIGILVLMLAVLWYFFKTDISMMLAYTRLGYLHVISLFTNQYDVFIPALEKRISGEIVITWPSVVKVSTVIGDLMKWPVSLLMGYYLWWMLMRSPTRKFRTKFTLESLIKIQSKIWPVISPVVDFNPLKNSQRIPGSTVPMQLPAFAESLSPEEWVAWSQLRISNERKLDREEVKQAFVKQLGPRWEGFKGLRDHHRALLAAFALRGEQKRADSDALLGDIAACWSVDHGLKLTSAVRGKIDTVLHDEKATAAMLKAMGMHAFRTTAMLGALKWARDQGGVLAPASFLWLRAVDRGLWYPLNNLGRRSYHSEASGAMAHFMAEQFAKRALPIPRVDTAVDALVGYIESSAMDIPETDAAPVRDTAKLKLS